MSEKVGVMTGGTRGIGFSTVQAFLNDGYRVILDGSREATVSKALSELEGQKVEGRWTSLDDAQAISKEFAENKETS